MLTRDRRITSQADFRHVMRRGARRVSPHLTVFALKTGAPSRFGFIVGKTVSKRAVVRNLVKRRLRALAADAPSGYDIVVLAAADAEFETLRAEFVKGVR